ncbi:MAG: alpha/beta hydrolase, partial [Gelidibacter sp.]|nr:alpha/beta hydrolase [Gelidibacter sp.]
FLYGAALELHTIKNKLYAIRFKRHLVNRLKQKLSKFPEQITKAEIKQIKILMDFDEVYTSKAHGFANALDYYEKSSSLQYLQHIKIPTLIINALNDSFLSAECYPITEAKQNSHLHLEMPKHGGHVGFVDKKNVYYNEKRALEFINAL